jgi:hypothetical protein
MTQEPVLEIRSWGWIGIAGVVLGIPIAALFGALAATRDELWQAAVIAAVGLAVFLYFLLPNLRSKIEVGRQGITVANQRERIEMTWDEITKISVEGKNRYSESQPVLVIYCDEERVSVDASMGLARSKRVALVDAIDREATRHGVHCSLTQHDLSPN